MTDLGALKNYLGELPGTHAFILNLCSHVPESASVWAVGGTIRDVLSGHQKIKDLDLMVADSEEKAVAKTLAQLKGQKMIRTFQKVGVSFPVFKIHLFDSDEALDVALARTESSTGPGHRDFTIFADQVSAREDAARRDFTVNALMLHLRASNGEIEFTLHDFFDGLTDLKERRLRAVGIPEERFEEDPLRILRALRFKHQKGFIPDAALSRTMQEQSLKLLPTISPDRIQDEVLKAMEANPSGMLEDLIAYDIFPACLNRLSYLKVNPPGWMLPDPLPSREIANAALILPWLALHDFHCPEDKGLREIEQDLIALHFPNPRYVRGVLQSFVDLVLALEHESPLAFTEKTLESHTGRDALFLFEHFKKAHQKTLPDLPENRPPRINGKALMQWGLKPGPGFELLVLRARELQLHGKTEAEVRAELTHQAI